MITYDEIISVMFVVSTKMTDTIPTNVPKSSDNKKVKHCKALVRTKKHWCTNNVKLKKKKKKNELRKVRIKTRASCYFDNIMKLEDFDFDNILIDEKSYENILIWNFY